MCAFEIWLNTTCACRILMHLNNELYAFLPHSWLNVFMVLLLADTWNAREERAASNEKGYCRGWKGQRVHKGKE